MSALGVSAVRRFRQKVCNTGVDIVVGNQASKNVAYFNEGTGESFRQHIFGPKAATYDIALVDLNGDSFPDVVAVNSDSHNQCFINLAAR